MIVRSVRWPQVILLISSAMPSPSRNSAFSAISRNRIVRQNAAQNWSSPHQPDVVAKADEGLDALGRVSR